MTNLKLSESLLATVQWRRLHCHLLNSLAAGNRGSYMSAHDLLNSLNELGKRDKMRGLPSILSLFRNEFNKFNNTRAIMLNFIKITLKPHF